MVRFTAKLAGIPIGISALFEQTRAAYRDYLTTDAPLFTLETTEQALTQEYARIARRRALNPQKAIPHPALLEEQWLYHQIGDRLPAYDALLVHGSAVAVDGVAYLFTAPSQTGKSTHTRLWRQVFGDRAVMVNDDKPLLAFGENAVLVCGSPWRGKHRLGGNITVPLGGICLLTRSSVNTISPLSAKAAFPALLQQCCHPDNPQRMKHTLSLLEQLTQRAALYRLGCNMRPEAAEVAYRGMNGDRNL